MRYSLTLALLTVGSSAWAGYFDVEMPPEQGEAYKQAKFRLWLPEVPTIRGIIVRQHGCGRAGVAHADDLQWQALAEKHGCALLGTHFIPVKECGEWFDPARGSERAFLAALKHFAKESKHPELETAPWAIWGHSGGAIWAMHMSFRQPERVLAAFPRSQAVGGENLKACTVPMMIQYGAGEKTGRFEKVHLNSQAEFAKYRPQGAIWAVAIDPKTDHNCGKSRTLAIPFFDAVLTQRLPEKPGLPLREMDAKRAWLGDPETLTVAPIAEYKGDPKKACWLPDEAVAKAWVEFSKTGEVADKTPPPAPTQLFVSPGGLSTSWFLHWKASADLESGIRSFIVYQNDVKVGEVGGTITKSNPKGYFQLANYGDEPEPTGEMLMRFRITEADKAAVLAVSAVNHAGLESAKTVRTVKK